MNKMFDSYTNLLFNKPNKTVREIIQMTVNDLRVHFGVSNNNQLAKKINRSRGTITDWEKNGVPGDTQATLQILTKNKLLADIEKISAKFKAVA